MEPIGNAALVERRTMLVAAAVVAIAVAIGVGLWTTSDDRLTSTADAALALGASTTADVAPASPSSTVSAPATTSARSTTSTTSTSEPMVSTTSSMVQTPSTTTVSAIDDSQLLPTLVEGDTGIEVAVMQRMLNIVTGVGIAADGVYGAATTEAVSAFQRFVELPDTGEADHTTRMLLKFIDAGRSSVLPTWPLPTIGDGGANGCQVAVIGDSLIVGRERLHRDRLAEVGCASAVDAVGGRSLAFGWQCRVTQPSGSRPLLLLAEPEPGNQTCAPSGLTLLEMWADAGAVGDVVVIALGTNDAGLFTERYWTEHWQQAFAFAGARPVVLITTQARPGNPRVALQAAYSHAARRWCSTVPRCVLGDWALTAAANDPASYVDSVHLTAAGADARATFIRDVVDALVSGRPIPDPAPLPTPTSAPAPLPSTTTSTSTTSTTSTSTTSTTSTVPASTTSTSTTSTSTTSTSTSTTSTIASTTTTTSPVDG